MSIGLYFFKSEVTLLLFGRCMFKGGVPIWVVNFMGEVVGGVEGFCFTSAMLFSGTLRSRLGLLLNRLEVRF